METEQETLPKLFVQLVKFLYALKMLEIQRTQCKDQNITTVKQKRYEHTHLFLILESVHAEQQLEEIRFIISVVSNTSTLFS